MAEPNKDSNFDDFSSRPDKQEKPEADMGGLVDELRKIMQDADQKKSAPPPQSEPEPTSADNILSQSTQEAAADLLSGALTDESLREEPTVDPTEKMGDAAFNPQAPEPTPPPAPPPPPPPQKNEPVVGNQQPSDSDFWSGNVLGWPEKEPEPQAPPTPEPSNPFQQEKPPAPPQEESPFLFGAFGEEAPPPAPPPVQEIPSSQPASEPEIASPDIEALDQLFPHAPDQEKPLQQPAPTPEPEPGPTLGASPFGDPGGMEEFLQTPSEPAPEPQPAQPPSAADIPDLPQDSEPQEEIPVPIPGTLEEKNQEASKGNENLNLETKEMKPDGLIQVACVFPEGHQAKAEDFVNRLRDAGSKARKPLSIQAVYVQPWDSSDVDVSSWEKSADLSGSNFMFVLVSKKEKDIFKDQIRCSRNNSWKGRVVFLEQVSLRSLYTDILVQMGQSG